MLGVWKACLSSPANIRFVTGGMAAPSGSCCKYFTRVMSVGAYLQAVVAGWWRHCGRQRAPAYLGPHHAARGRVPAPRRLGCRERHRQRRRRRWHPGWHARRGYRALQRRPAVHSPHCGARRCQAVKARRATSSAAPCARWRRWQQRSVLHPWIMVVCTLHPQCGCRGGEVPGGAVSGGYCCCRVFFGVLIGAYQAHVL